MPVVHIEFDGDKVSDKEALSVSEAIQKIVSEVTGIEDVCVYSNNAKIKVKIAPIEIFVQMSDHKIKDEAELTAKIKQRLHDWMIESKFVHKINLTLIPMHWKIEIDV